MAQPITSERAPSADPRYSVVITDQLLRRPVRAHDNAAELAAMQQVVALVAQRPADAIARFLDITLELCDAGSAGLSILVDQPGGTRAFHWDCLSGAFERFSGGTTPVDFSPCGLCIAAGKAILVERPARVFTYLHDAAPAIVEGLIVPLYDGRGVALGTLWVVSHDEHRRFDARTARQMGDLAALLALAIRLRAEDAKLEALLDRLRPAGSGAPKPALSVAAPAAQRD
ncbi:GAF domain-containing protein [Roseomonas sp. CECT 9278]|uniref:GAF domain-containing protein n=1 Tax=Roseomonas sp. CECT 9278 TaxID=2845823 RepID=UPI001E493BA6|nr:GAF domain-containing protein [Roseomonas sp. CECT 9278]CAH0306776.1 hypothetical protein ROS9278_04759 [Roseomonas sp. CECT 9278]